LLAVSAHNYRGVRRLINQDGIKIVANKKGTTALHAAVALNLFEMVRDDLLPHMSDAEILIVNQVGHSALDVARIHKRVEIEHIIVDRVSFKQLASTLFLMLSNPLENNKEPMQQILQKYPRLINVTNAHGDTPLTTACRSNRADYLKFLAEFEGIEYNKANKNGDTALLIATENEHLEAVAFLLPQLILTQLTHKNLQHEDALTKANLKNNQVISLLIQARLAELKPAVKPNHQAVACIAPIHHQGNLQGGIFRAVKNIALPVASAVASNNAICKQ
jgi:ankyrin repeat protein